MLRVLASERLLLEEAARLFSVLWERRRANGLSAWSDASELRRRSESRRESEAEAVSCESMLRDGIL